MAKETKQKETKQKETVKKEKNKKVLTKKDTKETTKVSKKEKKSLWKKIIGYFKGVKKEVSRIRWTKGKDLLKYSIAAIIFIIFFGVFFYVIDMLMALLRSVL